MDVLRWWRDFFGYDLNCMRAAQMHLTSSPWNGHCDHFRHGMSKTWYWLGPAVYDKSCWETLQRKNLPATHVENTCNWLDSCLERCHGSLVMFQFAIATFAGVAFSRLPVPATLTSKADTWRHNSIVLVTVEGYLTAISFFRCIEDATVQPRVESKVTVSDTHTVPPRFPTMQSLSARLCLGFRVSMGIAVQLKHDFVTLLFGMGWLQTGM